MLSFLALQATQGGEFDSHCACLPGGTHTHIKGPIQCRANYEAIFWWSEFRVHAEGVIPCERVCLCPLSAFYDSFCGPFQEALPLNNLVIRCESEALRVCVRVWRLFHQPDTTNYHNAHQPEHNAVLLPLNAVGASGKMHEGIEVKSLQQHTTMFKVRPLCQYF